MRKNEKEASYRVNLIYQSVDQLRTIQPLSLNNPPMIVPIHFKNINTDEHGMISQEELMKLFEDKIYSYYELEELYSEEQLDEAA